MSTEWCILDKTKPGAIPGNSNIKERSKWE